MLTAHTLNAVHEAATGCTVHCFSGSHSQHTTHRTGQGLQNTHLTPPSPTPNIPCPLFYFETFWLKNLENRNQTLPKTKLGHALVRLSNPLPISNHICSQDLNLHQVAKLAVVIRSKHHTVREKAIQSRRPTRQSYIAALSFETLSPGECGLQHRLLLPQPQMHTHISSQPLKNTQDRIRNHKFVCSLMLSYQVNPTQHRETNSR